MNTLQYARGISLNFNKWLFATILTVAMGVLLTLLVSWSSVFTIAIVLSQTTSLLSTWAQISMIQSVVPIQVSRWRGYLACSSTIGWLVSFLVIYLVRQPIESWINSAINSTHTVNVVWAGLLVGGIVGLFPGIFIGFAYWWLTRPGDIAKRLFANNVIGWCLGMSLGFTIVLVVVEILLSHISLTIF